MKRKMLHLCSLVGLLIGLMVSAQAQTQYKAHIPFDFSVGKQNLKAGDYIISLTSKSSSRQSLTIREAKTGLSKFVLVIPKETIEMMDISKLIFNRYDNQYFLAKMMTPDLCADFLKTKTEVILAKQQKARQETVAMK